MPHVSCNNVLSSVEMICINNSGTETEYVQPGLRENKFQRASLEDYKENQESKAGTDLSGALPAR